MENIKSEEKKDLKLFISKFSEKIIPFTGLIIISLILTIASPYFLTVDNLLAIGVQTTVIALMGIGVTFVIITAGIDLSVGSILGLSGIVATLTMANGLNMYLAILLGLITGLVAGFINGFITAKGKIHAFIATLGMMGIARGISLLLTGGIPVYQLPPEYDFLGAGRLFGIIPVPLVILTVVAVLAHIVLSKTKIGRYTYAIGSNKDATLLSGINVDKYTMIIYSISGLMAGLAGVVQSSRLITGQPTAGTGYEMDAIASAVIGGTSLLGGEGSIIGTIIGALIIGVLRNGANLLNISEFVQRIVIGVIIIVAVIYDRKRREKSFSQE
ncbi:ribose ABC transporter permease [Iocasia frigidifontis]|uniref:Ribose ABC transporter permease n=1 Tax=Iocasia fonsfrigidae TaxID=2682810 RepID=A0A8A7KDX9_9FIRM|nr:ABC transporter permease [Iocasia fonsfrigidae]QTL99621.1 ribose ABC transporter permease [Iocasia fonsfrigidae]